MLNLEELAKEYNVKIEELKSVEEDIKKKYTNVFTMMTADKAQAYVDAGVMQHLNKFKDMQLIQINGIILTHQQPKDGIKKKRVAAVKAYLENGEEALKAGVVAEIKDGVHRTLTAGGTIISKSIDQTKIPTTAVFIPDKKVHVIPLDNKAVWASGKKNFNYLRPLAIEQFFSNISGISLYDGIYRPFKMTINDCDEYTKMPIGIPVKFHAKMIENTPAHLTLGYNKKYTIFEPTNMVVDVNVNAAINAFYDDVTIVNLGAEYDPTDRYQIIAISGMINKVWLKEPTEDKPFPWSTIVISDATSTVKVLFHPNINIASMEEGMFVKVWGTISKGEKYDSTLGKKIEGSIEYTIFGSGFYLFSTPKTETVNEEWEEVS